MAQTSYSLNHAIAFAGMKADSQFSHIAAFSAEAQIAFGLGVTRGTDPEIQSKAISAVGDEFLGITLYHESQTTGDYTANDPEAILKRGNAWVPTTGAVVAGEIAYVNVTTAKFEAGTTLTDVFTGTFTAGSIGLTIDGNVQTVAFNTNMDTSLDDLATAIAASASVTTSVNTTGTVVTTPVKTKSPVISYDLSLVTGALAIARTLSNVTTGGRFEKYDSSLGLANVSIDVV